MIVRILGEGQYELPDTAADSLEQLDRELLEAMEAADEERFAGVLDQLLGRIRGDGKPVDAETIVPSDLTVPDEGATLEEVQQLLASEPDDGTDA